MKLFVEALLKTSFFAIQTRLTLNSPSRWVRIFNYLKNCGKLFVRKCLLIPMKKTGLQNLVSMGTYKAR